MWDLTAQPDPTLCLLHREPRVLTSGPQCQTLFFYFLMTRVSPAIRKVCCFHGQAVGFCLVTSRKSEGSPENLGLTICRRKERKHGSGYPGARNSRSTSVTVSSHSFQKISTCLPALVSLHWSFRMILTLHGGLGGAGTSACPHATGRSGWTHSRGPLHPSVPATPLWQS